MSENEQEKPVKEVKSQPTPDPHTEMMKAVGNLQDAARKYCNGVSVKDLRMIGNILDEVKLEQKSF